MSYPTPYYNNRTLFWQDGQLESVATAGADVFSQTLHYGNGVFEGLRSYETTQGVQLFEPEQHFERLAQSAKAMGLPLPYTTHELIEATYHMLHANGLTDAYVRPLVYAQPNMRLQSQGTETQVAIMAWRWKRYLDNNRQRIGISQVARPHARTFYIEGKVCGQYANAVMATNDARQRGYDEALQLDLDGYVAQGPVTNFFMEVNEKLVTPPKGSIYPGITRAYIISLAKHLGIEVQERFFKPEEIKQANAAFFTGTAAEVAGIAQVDNIKFSTPWKDTLGYQLFQAYRKSVTQPDAEDFTLTV